MEKSKEIYLFHQGTYYHCYNLLGCHTENGGAWFRVWSPNAKEISVVGDFNGWNGESNKLSRVPGSDVWEVFVESVKEYDNYKYLVTTADGRRLWKADPFAFHSETNGGTCSKVYTLPDFEWTDKRFFEKRASENHYERPINIYEVNLASFKRTKDGGYYSYRMLADELVSYAKEMGYTHIELMPITEYPYDGSWGYQVTGYYSVTSRFGTPEDFMFFVNRCHEEGIGVIMDWVPAHFPKDEHGLVEWDGSYMFENQGWDRIEFKEWGTRRFDYGKTEVQSFLISSATFFIDTYHIDGIRVDAVASMLYLDYDKKPGEWVPNVNGDNKNLEAISFLQKLNTSVLMEYPHVMMIAEESTSWPMVTKPPYIGGLGFNYKWNIGWMNDTFKYIELDPFFRKDNHNKLTFSMFYAFSENFVLPVSHDEVVYGKRSLLNKMYGDYDQKFDLMRTFLMYMYAHPGKKLTFMGNEFAQFDEWNNSKGIDFMLLGFEKHKKMQEFSKDLNTLYLHNSELFEIDYSWEGFRWLTPDDNCNNVIAFERRNKEGEVIVCVANFSPCVHFNYRVGVDPGNYIEILNTNSEKYGGNGIVFGSVTSEYVKINGFSCSIELNLQPNSAVLFKKHELSISITSKLAGELAEGAFYPKNTHTPTLEAKNLVTKIIESKSPVKKLSTQTRTARIEDITEKKIDKIVERLEANNKDFSYSEIFENSTIEQSVEPKEVSKERVQNAAEETKGSQKQYEHQLAATIKEIFPEEKKERKTKLVNAATIKEIIPSNQNSDVTKQKEVSTKSSVEANKIEDLNKAKLSSNSQKQISTASKRGRGRPKKEIDPNAPAKIIRGRGRPKKSVDPNAPVKIKRGRGRPKKEIDPNAPAKIIRGRGRPKKAVDPNAPAKIKRGRGRPKKSA